MPAAFTDFLRHYLDEFAVARAEHLAAYLTLVSADRGTLLIEAGRRHPYAYFLRRGAARSFYLHDGREVCSWFAFENELLGSLASYRDEPATESIELLEPAELIRIHLPDLRRAAAHDNVVNTFIRNVLAEYAGFLEARLYHLQFRSARERYEALLALEPDLLQRVSLTHIASYLGISRETLSRLRGM